MTKTLRLICYVAGLLSLFLIVSPAMANMKTVRVGIVRDGMVIRYDEQIPKIQQDILELTKGEFDVQFPKEKTLDGNWQPKGVEKALTALLNDPEVDLILALGTMASQVAGHLETLNKPVIAPIIIDAELQNMPVKKGTSGKKNLLYINSFQQFERDLTAFLDIVPFTRLTVLTDANIEAAMPGIRERGRKISLKLGIQPVMIKTNGSAEEILQSIPPDTEAVIITPLVRLPQSEMTLLINGLNNKRLPTFSLWGRSEVEAGVLATLVPKDRMDRLSRRIALDVQQILLGTSPETIPVGFRMGAHLVINMETARQIGVYPTWAVMTEAELINQNVGDSAPEISISQAVSEAASRNTTVLAAEQNVDVAVAKTVYARGGLLPQIGISASGTVIDKESAEESFGRTAEREVTGKIGLSQLIYDDAKWANYTIRKLNQQAEIENKQALSLDISLACAVSYLNYLKARTLAEIRNDDLALTRANMERARGREAVGIASPAEVFRWESRLAQARKDVLEANAKESQALNELNRIMGRPIGTLLTPVDTQLKDPFFLISYKAVYLLADSPGRALLLMDATVAEALSNSHVLARIDAGISAKEREQLAARRSFYIPEVRFQAGASHNFLRDGAAEDGGLLPIAGTAISIAPPDDTAWSASITAQVPLFTSGSRRAEISRTSSELRNLTLIRTDTARQIETAVRQAMHQSGASFPGIQLSRDAASAAKKNLSLVTDAYEKGVMSIIDLLDAQTAALKAQQGEANAVYDFLIDLANIQRLLGQVDFSIETALKTRLLQRIEAQI